MLHHIQKSILDSLATAEKLRYGQIKPRQLDGNVFGYHLKQLIADRYVTKDDGNYSLTAKGRDYIVHRYENAALSAHTIFLIVVERRGQYLVRERRVQPLIAKSGFVHGEPKPDTDIVIVAQDRLRVKTGLDVSLEVRGTALIAQYLGDELQSYSHAVILYGTTDQEITITSDETGGNYWVSSADLTNDDILPSCRDIISHIDTAPFFLEHSYTL